MMRPRLADALQVSMPTLVLFCCAEAAAVIERSAAAATNVEKTFDMTDSLPWLAIWMLDLPRSAAESRRPLAPVITVGRFGHAIGEQLVHVFAVELTGARLGEVTFDIGKIETDTVAFRGCVDAIHVVDPAAGDQRRYRPPGDLQGLSIRFLPFLGELAVADDVRGALARRQRARDASGVDRRWIEEHLGHGAAIRVQLLIHRAVIFHVERDRRKQARNRRRCEQHLADQVATAGLAALRNRADVPDDGAPGIEVGRGDEQEPPFV